MEQTFYIVSLTGIYPGDEGDHSLWLFDNREAAISKYDSVVSEIKASYKELLDLNEAEEYEDDDCYSIRLKNAFIDILIRDTKADGSLTQLIF